MDSKPLLALVLLSTSIAARAEEKDIPPPGEVAHLTLEVHELTLSQEIDDLLAERAQLRPYHPLAVAAVGLGVPMLILGLAFAVAETNEHVFPGSVGAGGLGDLSEVIASFVPATLFSVGLGGGILAAIGVGSLVADAHARGALDAQIAAAREELSALRAGP